MILSPGAAAPAAAPVVGAAYNPFYPSFASAGVTYTNSNRCAAFNSTSNKFTTLLIPKPLLGVWYQEFEIKVLTGVRIGLMSAVDAVEPTTTYADATVYGFSYDVGSGQKTNNGSSSAYGATCTTGDRPGILFDGDAGTLSFTKNGVSQGVAYSGLSAAFYVPFFELGTGTTASVETPVTDTYTMAGALGWR